MKAIIFILILGIVLNASTPVYDIYYNLDYNLQQNLQTETNFLFRTPTNPGDKMDFVFTFPKSYVDTFNFFLSVCQCTKWPSNEEMREMTFNDATYCYKFTRYTDYYDDDNYHYYYFTYPINGYIYDNAKYLAISVYYRDYKPYSYLKFKIDAATYKYSNIKELEYNQNYHLDTSIFHHTETGKIPANYQIYIRIKVNSNDEMEIRLTTNEYLRYDNLFTVDIGQFQSEPSDSDVYYAYNADVWKHPNVIQTTDKNLYKFPFTTEDKIKFLTIRIINSRELNELGIYIYSEIGMAAAIIAVIVIVPLLVIGGIVGFFLKKCGCIGGGVSSTAI